MKSVSAAVKGLGKLSRAIGLVNGDDAVNKLLERVAERAEQLFIEYEHFITFLQIRSKFSFGLDVYFWLSV